MLKLMIIELMHFCVIRMNSFSVKYGDLRNGAQES